MSELTFEQAVVELEGIIKKLEEGRMSLEDAVKACFQGGEPCYYALSDLYPGNNFKLDTFSIISEKRIRNLMTRYRKAPYLRKINKSPAQFYLVGAGSVFYGHKPVITKDTYYLNAGYNSLIEIGGSTK